MNDGKLLVTVDEAAERLSIGRSLCYDLVMRGQIASVKVGRCRRVPVTALERFIAQQLEDDVDGAVAGTGGRR